jgi:twinkle protein
MSQLAEVVHSKFTRHSPCESCGSRDANAIYEDQLSNGDVSIRTFCFSCEKITYPDQERHSSMNNYVAPVSKERTDTSAYQLSAIPDRKISKETAETFGVRVSKDSNGSIISHVYPFYEKTGQKIVAYKKRHCADKGFTVVGPEKGVNHSFDQASLFGQQLFSGTGKYITMTEGELDAMAAYQMLGSKWPVVSLRSGAQGAERDIRKNLEFFNSYDKVVLCLDNDEPGKKATQKLSEIFEIGKCLVMPMSRKDPCEYLQSGDTLSFTREWWRAKPLSPDGIVSGEDIWDVVSTELENNSISYPWEDLNKVTYGIRCGELVTITAGSGIGKSAILREIIYHILKNTEENVGALFMEESIRRTAQGLMSIDANKQFHLPTTVYTQDELKTAFENTVGCGRVYLYDHFGSSEIDNIVSRIRYMAKGLECKYVFLDHISIIVSSQENGDERKALDEIMTKLRMLVQETNISLFVVSHLKRPQNGGGHEIGGVTTLSQLRGSAGIAQLSDIVLGLERNSQDDDPIIRNTTIVRVLKNRFSGETGPTSRLVWSKETGRLNETFEDLEADIEEAF